MAHPYSKEAHSSNKAKAHSMGKVNNLDIPIMRAVGENRSGGIHESSASMQHKKQAGADGMKRGGRKYAEGGEAEARDILPNPFDTGTKTKPSRSKPKPIQPTPLPPNELKRGGHVKHKAKPMVVPAAPAIPPSADPAAMAAAGAGASPAPAPIPGQPPMKRGGRTNGGHSYPLNAGSRSGEGRLEKAHMGKPPFKAIKGHGE